MEDGSFRSVIHNILNRWSGLKLCVDHQSGGRQSMEKALYLIDYIHEVLIGNNKVEPEDLEDLIADYMDNEMQTMLEDDSVREISRALLRFHEMFQSGRQAELIQELSSLPASENWLVIVQRPVLDDSDDSESSDESDNENDNQLENMDCEWTKVTYRKHRPST